MFTETECLDPLVHQKLPSDETFYIAEEELPQWNLFTETGLPDPLAHKKPPSDETFFLGDEEIPRWNLFTEIGLPNPLAHEKPPSDETFFLGDEEIPRWTLFDGKWIELDESMFRHGDELCPECKELGYCKREADEAKQI